MQAFMMKNIFKLHRFVDFTNRKCKSFKNLDGFFNFSKEGNM